MFPSNQQMFKEFEEAKQKYKYLDDEISGKCLETLSLKKYPPVRLQTSVKIPPLS